MIRFQSSTSVRHGPVNAPEQQIGDVVHDAIEPAEAIHRCTHRRLDHRRIGHVHADIQRLTPALRISVATACPFSSVRPLTTTAAPSAAGPRSRWPGRFLVLNP